MKKLVSIIAAGAAVSSGYIANAQNANYTTFGQLTQAASQASNGQLAMVHGGFLGGGMSNPGPAAVTTTTSAGGNILSGVIPGQDGNAIDTAENSNLWIAATVGAAALLIPVAVSFLTSEDN